MPTTRAAVPVSLHADAQRALAITGHSDQATPSWVSALVDCLHTAAERGNRRALLTLRWLTDGWDDVTPRLTESDRGWLLIATTLGISIAPTGVVQHPSIRSVANIGRVLTLLSEDTVMLTTILDALRGIGTIPPAAGQAVTPLHVLRLLVNRPFPSRTDLQQVLRAVRDGNGHS